MDSYMPASLSFLLKQTYLHEYAHIFRPNHIGLTGHSPLSSLNPKLSYLLSSSEGFSRKYVFLSRSVCTCVLSLMDVSGVLVEHKQAIHHLMNYFLNECSPRDELIVPCIIQVICGKAAM